MKNVSNGLIYNVTVSHSSEDLIYLFECENVTIKTSYVQISGLTRNNILIDYSSNIQIINNTITNSATNGIKLRDSSLVNITYNYIRKNNQNGITLGNCENISVLNNIIGNNYFRGIAIEGNSIFSSLTNNIIFNNQESGLFIIAINTQVREC